MPGTSNRLSLSPAVAPRQMSRRVTPRTTKHLTASAERLLDQVTFRGAIVRERQQADRFDTTFGLLLVIPRRHHCATSDADSILAALAATGEGTDVYGWFEQDTVVGMIRWHREGRESAAAARAEVERELERRLGDVSAEYRVRSHVYSADVDSLAAPFRDTVLDQSSSGTFHQLAKRALDIAGSAALLLASSPLFIACAVVVKATSKGSVFFCQQRVGEYGKPFMMLKFRTMHADARQDLHQQYVSQFIHGDIRGDGAATTPVFKIVADPRVTKVGHFLRRSSLDELPQFWNVLKGDMSLVGPRPPLPYEVKVYKAWHWRRLLEAKPGITGLWQVTGRSRTTFDEMVRLDIRYARNQSVWTDVRILLATPRAVISGNGAH
jgi:lipopolysaccharide/colanic/teichoic acid biosynthesis glycosyltransferase